MFEFTYTLKVLLDLITKKAKYQDAVAYLLLMCTLILIKLVWVAWIEQVVTPKNQEILHKKLRMELYQKAISLDLENYDNPEYYNEFVWSSSEASILGGCNLLEIQN